MPPASSTSGGASRVVLFLCSGNYYRSRFAEAYFNARAAALPLPWVAVSRGFRLSAKNVGPVSPFVPEALRRSGLAAWVDDREPRTVADADFDAASLVVCLKEAEHRPMMERMFPLRIPQVEFWRIDDVDCALPDDALSQLATEIDRLTARLSDVAPSAVARPNAAETD